MTVSVFDIFKPGVGPSSSHTMGPMRAAGRFVERLRAAGLQDRVRRVEVKLYASLALTGRGHGTDRAVMLGLMGFDPATLDPDGGEAALVALRAGGRMTLGGGPAIGFDEATDIVWAGRERLPQHPNALTFTAFDATGGTIAARSYFSIGGGFVRDEAEMGRNTADGEELVQPFPFESAADLLAICAREGLTIAELMLANETAALPRAEVEARLDALHAAMEACIDRGLRIDGELPGGLRVKRRAMQIHASIIAKAGRGQADPLAPMDFVNLWALAVNEENAAGGRVVTAPTNGAAGIIPAVLRFYERYVQRRRRGPAHLPAHRRRGGRALQAQRLHLRGRGGLPGRGGGGLLHGRGGSAAALGGTNAQIENAAEIGMEHNLGLTCDPIGGLVQIPCIERNAMGAIKAIDAARLALLGEGEHHVSLDKVIATMKRTGADMSEIYKETSLGGLAVNQVEC